MGVQLNIDANVVRRIRRLADTASDELAVTAALEEWLAAREGKEAAVSGRASMHDLAGVLGAPANNEMSAEEFERLSRELRDRTRLRPQTPSELLLAEARGER